MDGKNQNIESAGNLREFLEVLHQKLLHSEGTFPFPAVKHLCASVLDELAANLKRGPESAEDVVAAAAAALLVLVCDTDCPELPQRLLSLGLDPDCSVSSSAEEHSGITPLARAAIAGNLGVCRVLVEAGAEIEKPSHGSQITPMMVAAGSGHVELTR